MLRPSLYNKTRTLALVCTLLTLISSYPQPVVIPAKTNNKFIQLYHIREC
jgi:hypothetical protein